GSPPPPPPASTATWSASAARACWGPSAMATATKSKARGGGGNPETQPKPKKLKGAPSILPLYAKAAAPMIPGASMLPFVPGGGGEIPAVRLELGGVVADPDWGG